MTLAILCIIIGVLCLVLTQWPDKVPKEPKSHSFTASVKAGTLKVTLGYSNSPMLPNIEMVTRRWAIGLTNPVLSDDLYEDLSTRLASFHVLVVKLEICPESTETEPKKRTIVDDVQERLADASALLALKDTIPDQFKQAAVDHIDRRLKFVLDPPGHHRQ